MRTTILIAVFLLSACSQATLDAINAGLMQANYNIDVRCWPMSHANSTYEYCETAPYSSICDGKGMPHAYSPGTMQCCSQSTRQCWTEFRQ